MEVIFITGEKAPTAKTLSLGLDLLEKKYPSLQEAPVKEDAQEEFTEGMSQPRYEKIRAAQEAGQKGPLPEEAPSRIKARPFPSRRV